MAVKYPALSSSLGSCCPHRSLPARAPPPLRSRATVAACSHRRAACAPPPQPAYTAVARSPTACEPASTRRRRRPPMRAPAIDCPRELAPRPQPRWPRLRSSRPPPPPVPVSQTLVRAGKRRRETGANGSKRVRPASQGNISGLGWFHSRIHGPNVLETGMEWLHNTPSHEPTNLNYHFTCEDNSLICLRKKDNSLIWKFASNGVPIGRSWYPYKVINFRCMILVHVIAVWNLKIP